MNGRASSAIGMVAVALLAGCAGKSEPAPVTAPVARPVAAPVAEALSPAPAIEDWPDRALTPGDWSYGDGEARFAGFSLRCDRGRGAIVVDRDGAGGALRIRTSYGERTLASGAAIPAVDPLLDEMAFSRGRFAVETPGADALVVPARPEPARVIEDCRG